MTQRIQWGWVALVCVALLGVADVLLLLANEGALPLVGRRDLTWAEMERSRDFRVGVDPSFPPFEQLSESGVPEGFDLDLANALANEWGFVAKINGIGFDSLVDAVMASRVDAVISAMPYDERLTKDVAYSIPYFDAGIRIGVTIGSPITGTAGLEGMRVGVEWGSTGDMVARRLQRGDGVEPPVALEIVQFETPQDVIDALAAGDADAVLVDQVSLRIAQGNGAEIVAVGEVMESTPYVLVSPKRATRLAQEINAALERLKANGTLQELEDKWFGAAKGTTP